MKKQAKNKTHYHRTMEFKHTIPTAGDGLWSAAKKRVKTTTLEVDYPFGQTYGELRVYFDTKTWNCHEEGLIYTDDGWEYNLKRILREDWKLSEVAANDIDYSEQGMQGEDYVSLDCGAEFYKEWRELYL